MTISMHALSEAMVRLILITCRIPFHWRFIANRIQDPSIRQTDM